jgi:hypothetical protein
MKHFVKILVTLVLMLAVNYCVSAQNNFSDSSYLIKQRFEAFEYYNNSYKRQIDKEVYVQKIRQPEIKQIVVNNYYDSYDYQYYSRIQRFNRGIINYGYFGSYYMPYNYVIPVIHIRGHNKHHK